MSILYLHGFGSGFNENSAKCKVLSKLGTIVGLDLDYTNEKSEILNTIKDFIYENTDIEFIVGTSLGAYFAAEVGPTLGLPFVAINPAINPSDSLKAYVGSGMTYTGHKYYLPSSIVEQYTPFSLHGCGLIILDEGDELFKSAETIDYIGDRFSIKTFEGGSHRFDHMSESMEDIEIFIRINELVYGG